MPKSLTQEIDLLRTLASHLERRPLLFEKITQELLRREGLGHVREKRDGVIAIRAPGHLAFPKLVDCLIDRLPGMARGTIYTDVQTELFNFIENYVGREASTVGNEDAKNLIAHFGRWFSDKALSRRVFVPCVISRTVASRFEIGPIAFEFIDRIAASDFYPRGDESVTFDQRGFDDLLRWMRERDADWLARVSVDGCEQKRAEEVAELAVDLAIVGLQLSAPYLDTRTMTRLDARRGTSQKRTLSEANGYHSVGWTRKEPGMAIGQGTLPDILQKAAPVFAAVGNVVSSFASGSYRLPSLEQAWCDASCWFHQALGESIDTIAIAKLETSLEILLRAQSSKGSERRILELLNAFFDVSKNDPIALGSLTTAREFARNVVRDRSRILHGTWSTLNARGIDREGMTGFVTTVLRIAVVELEAYIRSERPQDDIDNFLKWAGQHRKSAVVRVVA